MLTSSEHGNNISNVSQSRRSQLTVGGVMCINEIQALPVRQFYKLTHWIKYNLDYVNVPLNGASTTAKY
jgi:hypothetical protein